MSDQGARSAADDATRGTAIKLAAEVLSRLLTFATTLLLMRSLGPGPLRRLRRAAAFTRCCSPSSANWACRTSLRARWWTASASLRSLLRARFVATVARQRSPPSRRCRSLPLSRTGAGSARALRRRGRGASTASARAAVAWLALSGWGEFLGVALRCRARAGSRRRCLLLVLRGGGLALVVARARRRAAACVPFAPRSPSRRLPALLLAARSCSGRSAAGRRVRVRPQILRDSSPLALYGGLLLLSPRVELLVLGLAAGRPAEVGLFTWPRSPSTGSFAGAAPLLPPARCQG